MLDDDVANAIDELKARAAALEASASNDETSSLAEVLFQLYTAQLLAGQITELEQTRERMVAAARRTGDHWVVAVMYAKDAKWAKALQEWEKYEEWPVARLNQAICQYHLNRDEAMVSSLLALSSGMEPPLFFHAALMAILSLHRGDRWQKGASIAAILGTMSLDAWDLPTIPTAVTDSHIFEGRSVGPIVEVLGDLLSVASDEEEKEAIRALIDAYEQRRNLAEAKDG